MDGQGGWVVHGRLDSWYARLASWYLEDEIHRGVNIAKSVAYISFKLDSWSTYYESSNMPPYYPTKSPASQSHTAKPKVQHVRKKAADKMGQVHKLILDHGKAGALKFDVDRRVVEAAAAYMGAEDGEIGFLYSGWAQSGLPHKRLADDAAWQVRTDHVSLVVQPGLRHTATGAPVPVGVPYGSRARLICIYLQSEALRCNSREVELGKSLHAWLRKLDISIGGKSMAAVRDQAERISRCRMSFQIKQGNRTGLVNQNILDTAMFVDDDSEQGSLFVERAKLSEMFYEQLRKHPVPVEEAAIKAISNNSMAIDVYCWLAYRLHVLEKSTPVSWKALHGQFGNGIASLVKFRQLFRATLDLATSVYPDAKIDVEERGVTLHPSKPPVPPKVLSGTNRLIKTV